jgi:cobalt-precorrin-5B (C1)-methyltransferase
MMAEGITDPVTGFTYPEAWIGACEEPAALALVREGLAVLTSSGTILRRGYTTGTTAAACCKAAILSCSRGVTEVIIKTPSGLSVLVPVHAAEGKASCRKYAGDYPGDATADLLFCARYTPKSVGLELVSGEGIGRFTRQTRRHYEGEPAISKPARECIFDAMEEALEETCLEGARVVLEIPDGCAIATKTLNPKIGIEGGLSILGTTGLVEPWDDHLSLSVIERVKGSSRVVLTTGRTGLFHARLLFPGAEVILAGARLGEALESASGEVVLCGLPGLILKFLYPEILESTSCLTVEELTDHPLFEERMGEAFRRGKVNYPRLRVMVLDRKGIVLGDSG